MKFGTLAPPFTTSTITSANAKRRFLSFAMATTIAVAVLTTAAAAAAADNHPAIRRRLQVDSFPCSNNDDILVDYILPLDVVSEPFVGPGIVGSPTFNERYQVFRLTPAIAVGQSVTCRLNCNPDPVTGLGLAGMRIDVGRAFCPNSDGNDSVFVGPFDCAAAPFEITSSVVMPSDTTTNINGVDLFVVIISTRETTTGMTLECGPSSAGVVTPSPTNAPTTAAPTAAPTKPDVSFLDRVRQWLQRWRSYWGSHHRT